MLLQLGGITHFSKKRNCPVAPCTIISPSTKNGDSFVRKLEREKKRKEEEEERREEKRDDDG